MSNRNDKYTDIDENQSSSHLLSSVSRPYLFQIQRQMSLRGLSLVKSHVHRIPRLCWIYLVHNIFKFSLDLLSPFLSLVGFVLGSPEEIANWDQTFTSVIYKCSHCFSVQKNKKKKKIKFKKFH